MKLCLLHTAHRETRPVPAALLSDHVGKEMEVGVGSAWKPPLQAGRRGRLHSDPQSKPLSLADWTGKNEEQNEESSRGTGREDIEFGLD